MDDGGAVDAAATDATTPGTDTGTPSGDCVLYVPRGSFGPLTPSCLPRCSAATRDTYDACTTRSCRSAATEGDTTPGIDYFIGTVATSPPLDCSGCVAYQEMHCFSLVCPSEVDGYVDQCIAGGSPSGCDAALTNLNSCLAGLSSSQGMTVDACFASDDGPAGCFP